MLLTLALAAAAAMVQPAPRPAPLRTFREWIVGCDNGHVCEAWALPPEGFQDDTETYLQLALSRGPEANAPLRLTWDNDLAGPAMLSVDGRVITPRATQDMALTPAMIDALRNGASASLAMRGRPRIQASLSGLLASLLAIDEMQGRVGTPTAAVRRGSQPMRAAVPVLPVIVRPPPSSRPPRTISPARAAAIIGPDNARCSYSDRPVESHPYRLDATHSLVLIDHPCQNGAYNYFTTAMIVDERGRATPARFDVDSMRPDGDDPTNEIVGAYYDAASRTLESYAKGRGIGDCGVSSSYVWNGSYFALASRAVMTECRLRMGFIPVWRATVR